MVDVFCRLRKFAIVKDGFVVSFPKSFGRIYRSEEFSLDMVSAFPACFLAFAIDAPAQVYGILRMFQFLRVVRFGKYLEGLVDAVNTRTRVVVTTATLRVCQIFMIILCFCHWFSCIFHFMGRQEGSSDTWIIVDAMQEETMGRRYLRSFYWSLYTITTIGYGSVPLVTIHERVLAMVAMAVGAVICDAGLTAVLASIVAKKDRQAGTNNRRIQCSKLFFSTNCVEEHLQTRIFEFYAYADNEMKNIDENEIIGNLSSPLACEILSHFCFGSLRECAHFDSYSDGALFSLIKTLKPYVAVPGEHLSEVGKECRYLYVFQKGTVQSKDVTGTTANVAEGAIIGHLATLATSKKEGMPTHKLHVELISAQLPRSKNGNPYVIVKNGQARCRSLIKSSRNWREKIEMKIKVGNGKQHKTEIIVKEWRGRQNHFTLGYGEIFVSESSSSDAITCSIMDEKGKAIGSIELRALLRELSNVDQLTCHEATSTALSFSHFYRLDVIDDQMLVDYMSKAKDVNIVNRIPVGAECTIGPEEALINDPVIGDFDWENPCATSVQVKQNSVNEQGKRRSVFFVEWTDK